MSDALPACRVGLLGGSFDPPHLAHLALARLALRDLQLSELRWLVAGRPWQKAGRTMAAPEHRVAMVRLLIDGEPGMAVDERELHRAGPIYTVDTLAELHAEQPHAELVLVIGQDQYGRFDTWRDWPRVLELATLAVAGRAGEPPSAPPALAAVPHRVLALGLPAMPHSSTSIRARVAEGGDVGALTGPAVASYISRHALYRAHRS